jgi:hypothetical protein
MQRPLGASWVGGGLAAACRETGQAAAAKADTDNNPFTAALKRCATQNPAARGEFPEASLLSEKMQGSFDSAGASLREVPAALRFCDFFVRRQKPSLKQNG